MFDTVHRFAADRYAMAQLCDALLPATALVGYVRQLRQVVETLTQLPFGNGETELTLAGGRFLLGQRETLVTPACGAEWPTQHLNRSVFVDNWNWNFALCGEVVWWSDELTPDAPEVLYHQDVLVYALMSEMTGCSVASMARAFAAEQGVNVGEAFEPALPDMCWELARRAEAFRQEELSEDARSARMHGYERA